MRKRWYRLDTAALIFPAIMRRDWCNVFRVSATLKEEVDKEILQQAVNDLKKRFPNFYVRLRAGLFWYYLQESETGPVVQEDFIYPLAHMGRREMRNCCVRVYCYRNRIAVECFHSVTDGTGGSIYLQSLLARYLVLKHGIDVEYSDNIRDCELEPDETELEDSFFKNAGGSVTGRGEATAFRLTGTEEEGGFRHLLTGVIPSEALLDAAHERNCTVTAFLSAVMSECLIAMQEEQVPEKRWRPVKIAIAVNLRKLYGSKTLRNFVLALNIGVDPRNGTYTLQELCDSIRHQLSNEATPQNMAGRIAANVVPQKVLAVRLAPRPLKNLIMGLVYADSGERKGCINISNLGNVKLPPAMAAYVERMEFIIGVQKSYPNNCSVMSCNGVTCINMIRSIRETEIERRFFSRLVELGVPVEIESNVL